MTRHPLTLLLAALLSPVCALAQFYSTGADPLSVRWQRLKGLQWTIYSDTAASQWATQADMVLTMKAPQLKQDYPQTQLDNLKIVVHSRNAFSNGLVSWAPSRMEAYAYDFGQDDCIPWTTHLLTHEYRHALQMQTLNNGFGKVLYVLFGEQATGLFAGLCVPQWFLEGDAVWAETEYTQGGRGRNADFIQQMRALCIEHRSPRYEEAYFGSYRRRFPDYYHMGYYTVTDLADACGHKAWSHALRKTSRYPWLLLPPLFGGLIPFNRYLRKHSGTNRIGAYYLSIWNRGRNWYFEDEKASYDTHSTLFAPNLSLKTDYVEATDVQPYRDGWVAYMESPSFVSYFAKIGEDGIPRKILTPSPRNENAFALHGDTIVWSERKTHPRWQQASTDRLMMADIRTGKQEVLTDETSMHSPAISPDGRRIAAVSIEKDMRHRLETISWDGQRQLLMTFPIPNMLTDLTWTDNNTIVGVMVSDNGKSLVAYDISKGSLTTLVPPRYANLRHPSAAGGKIFFTSDQTGKNELYAYDIETYAVTKLANERIGADYPQMTSKGLTASVYSGDGYTPSAIKMKRDTVTEQTEPTPTLLPQELATHPAKRVGPAHVHLRPNIHSWGFVDVDAESTSIKPALNLSSQNAHGTVMWEAGVNFGDDNDYRRYYASATIDWLFPRLTFSGTWGYRDYKQDYSVTSLGDTRDTYVVTQGSLDDRSRTTELEGSISLPLTFNSGPWLRGVMPYCSFDLEKQTGVTWDITQTTVRQGRMSQQVVGEVHKTETSDTERYFCMTTGLNLYMLGRKAQRDIDYRKGLNLKLIYDWTPTGIDYGKMFCASATAYAPGIGRHHSISLSLGWQKKWLGETYVNSADMTLNHILSDRVSAPHGMSLQKNTEALLFRATYALPIANPDWVCGPVAFIKRINLRAFYDLGSAKVYNTTDSQTRSTRSSVGADLWLETNLLRLPFPVNIGTRASWLNDSQELKWDLLLSVAFN